MVALRARQRAQVIEAPPARAALTAEARAFFERGAKLFRRGRYEAALAAFSAARDFADLPELSYNLALTCERLARWEDAIDLLSRVPARGQGSADAEAIEARVQELARKARALGDKARARASAEAAPATGRSPRRPAP